MNRLSLFAGALGVLICSFGGSWPGLPATATMAAANPACALVTIAEVEAALGGKVTGLANGPSGLPNGVELCTGAVGGATIGIRLIPELSPETANARQKLLELQLQMGAHIEKDSAGPISCQAVTPPAALAATAGFETSCAVGKPPKLATIEIGTRTQTAMVPIAKLRLIAQKMLSRM